jgi:hypothetical protein
MTEVFSLYIIALCSIVIAVGVFVCLVLLVSVRARLKKRDLARTEFHRSIGGRVDRIESFLVKQQRASEPLIVEQEFKISKFKGPEASSR